MKPAPKAANSETFSTMADLPKVQEVNAIPGWITEPIVGLPTMDYSRILSSASRRRVTRVRITARETLGISRSCSKSFL